MIILHKVTRQIFDTDQGQQDFRKFAQMREHAGFRDYLTKYLNLLSGLMLDDLLSDRFTKLDEHEKDSQQRAYAMAHRIIQFILRPEQEAQSLNLIKQHNMKMSAYLEGKPTRKEK